MKNVILISGLGLEGCMLCASIAQFIWEQNDVCVSFVPEEKVANLARKVDYFDLIILIDYNESILNNKKLNRLRGKLVLLKEIDEEIISKFIYQKEGKSKIAFDFEYLELINLIVKDVNNNAAGNPINYSKDYSDDYSDDCLDNENFESPEDLDLLVMETSMYIIDRYDRTLKVVENLCSLKGEIEFHEHFFSELIHYKETTWINNFLEKYEKMENETKRLITYIRMWENSGFLCVRNQYFFEEDILEFAEEKGYPAMTIEFRSDTGKYSTIYHETGDEFINFFPGKVKTNWYRTIGVKAN